MLNRIADNVVRRPWLHIALFVALTLFFALQLPGLEVDPELKNELPPQMPARVALDRIEELFGGTDILMVTVSAPDVLEPRTLSRVAALSRGMERMPVFDRVLGLFTLKEIQGDDAVLAVDPAVARVPRTAEEREALRRRLRDNRQVYRRVVSEDFRHTALVGILGKDTTDREVLTRVRELVRATPGPGTVEIGGVPFVRFTQGNDIRKDMRRLMPLGLLVMLAFLFVCFRQLRGVLLPFLVTLMAIVAAMGLIPLLGWKVMVVTVILPVLLIAVANDYGIHVLARFQERNQAGAGRSPRDLARDGIVTLGRPVLITGITTIAGLLCLLSHVLLSAEQMGILAAAGVAFALLGSLLFIPAVLAVLPLPRPARGAGGDPRPTALGRVLRAVARLVGRRPGRVVLAMGVATALVAVGIPRVEVDTNTVNYYPDDAPVARSTRLINDAFGGAYTVSFVAEGDIRDPEVLQSIDAFQRHLERHPKVEVTTSIAETVREINRVIHGGDPEQDRIPGARNTVAEYFLLYSMSGDPTDFDKLVDHPYRHAIVTARINDSSTRAITEVVRHAGDYLARHPGPFTVTGGVGAMFAQMVDRVVRGQLVSLALSLVLVGLLVGLLFRSVVAGLLAALPLTMAMLLLFGLMGLVGIQLNVATAMLSTIMIGVGVDYTIHFLWRLRAERGAGLAPRQAVARTLATTGRGIIFNGLSVVVGFAVLMVSSFLPVRFFGLLVVVCIGACLLGALVLLPAVTLLTRPRFLEPAPAAAPLPDAAGASLAGAENR